MNVMPDTEVVVYKFSKELFLRSTFSKFEVLIKYGTLVAYIEEYGILCDGNDWCFYSVEEYMSDILKTDTTEMTYNEYRELYKQKLDNMYPDAPKLEAQTQDCKYGTIPEQSDIPFIGREIRYEYTPYIPTQTTQTNVNEENYEYNTKSTNQSTKQMLTSTITPKNTNILKG